MSRTRKSSRRKTPKRVHEVKIEPVWLDKGPGDIKLNVAYRWAIIESMIKTFGLTSHHTRSYEKFIDEDIPSIIEQLPRIDANIGVFFDFLIDGKVEHIPDSGEVRFSPLECRWKGITYSMPLKIRFVIKRKSFREQDGKTIEVDEPLGEPMEIKLCDIPIMVGSRFDPYLNKEVRKDEDWLISLGEDPLQPEGYVIINGSERVFLPREENARSRIIVEELKGTSQTSDKFKVVAWITTPGVYRNRVSVFITRKDMKIVVRFPRIQQNKYIPLFVLVRALGLTAAEFISLVDPKTKEAGMGATLLGNFLFLNIYHAPKEALLSQEAALKELLKYIQKTGAQARWLNYGTSEEQKINFVKDVINRYFLPHLGTTEDSFYLKAYYLARIVKRAILVYIGKSKPDDRDHYKNKRLKMVGDFMRELFSHAWREFIRHSRDALASKAADIHAKLNAKDILKTEKFMDVMEKALATGTWPTRVTGVTEVFGQLNHIEMISHLRRVKNILTSRQQAKHGKSEARDLHPTQWGRICIITTSEGTMCGLTKQLALSAYVSVGLPREEKRRLVEEILPTIGLKRVKVSKGWIPDKVAVFIDGVFIGVVDDPKSFVDEFRKLRRSGKIPWEANIKYWPEWEEVHITADSGRILRPLIIVENGKPKYTPEIAKKVISGELKFIDLLKMGIIEMLDAEEEEDAYIAMWEKDVTEEHTHLEIAPATTLDIIPNLIPFANSDQAPKIIHETSMAKQALTIPRLNYRIRPETSTYLMYYPQRPLVTTRPSEFTGISDRGFGQNAIVAILSYEGFNIEDAIIINKAAIERGMFNGAFIRIYEVQERTHRGGEKDVIELPLESRDRDKGQLETLAEDGLPWEGEYLKENEEIVGKSSPTRRQQIRTMRVSEDTSEKVRPGEAGYIDSVVLVSLGELGQGGIKAYVKLRQPRPVELGDKFAARSGQKGVVGLIVPPEDMPFTEDGIIPDIIFNPHGIPSRMTVGYLLEALAGSIATKIGRPIDGTTFESDNWMDHLINWAKELGLNYYGEKTLYDGRTGKMYKAHILVGPIYYQRLKHLARDKIHVRSTGRVTLMTLQPPGGRARGGGLRLGEMERDSLVGHGVSMFLRERFIDSSDGMDIYVCDEHGLIARWDRNLRKWICPICKEKTKSVSKITVPYTFVLLVRELQSLGIRVELRVKEIV